MTEDERRVAESLGSAFGISFEARGQSRPLNMVVRLAMPPNEGLAIELRAQRRVRLEIKVRPERRSRRLMDLMASTGEYQRRKAKAALEELGEAVDDFEIGGGGADILLASVEAWANVWEDFSYRLSVRDFAGGSEQLEAAIPWAIRALSPLMELLPPRMLGPTGFEEGAQERVSSNRYERDSRNRRICIEARGHRCLVCGMDMGEYYGDIGEGFIHVHHVTPVSKMGPGYVVDPLVDLIPVCPNCHAMLHRIDPPMDPRELSQRIEAMREGKSWPPR